MKLDTVLRVFKGRVVQGRPLLNEPPPPTVWLVTEVGSQTEADGVVTVACLDIYMVHGLGCLLGWDENYFKQVWLQGL